MDYIKIPVETMEAIISRLTPEEIGSLFNAIIMYSLGCPDAFPSGNARFSWPMIQYEIDMQREGTVR